MKKYLIAPILLFCLAAYGATRLGNSDISVTGSTLANISSSGSMTLDPGSAGLVLTDLTATTVPYLDASKVLTSSAVTPTELGYLTGVTSALQTQIDAISGGGFTINRALVSDGSGDIVVSTTTATEIGHVAGVTSAIQTQLDAKVDEVSSTDNAITRFDGTGGAVQDSGITIDDSDNMNFPGLTANRVPFINASNNLAITSVTATEIQYVNGVTSAIQTQLDAKVDEVSSTDNAITRFNGTTGSVQDSGILIDDTDHITAIAGLDVMHTALEADDHAMEIDVNVDGFGDVKALDIDYITGAIAAGQDEAVILVNVDESLATGGDVTALEVLATEGSGQVNAVFSGIGVNPLEHLSGAFGDMDSALVLAVDRLTEFTTAANIQMFVADNDTVTIGDAAKFEELEFLLAVTASGSGIAPTFEFSIGVGTWTTFTPVDGTDGMRNSGVIAWLDTDIPTWAVGTGGEYLIRITRTRNSLSTPPTEALVQSGAATQFYWDKDANLFAETINLLGAITTVNAVLNTGVSGTAVLDEDTMSSNSSTQLATQQSIKAYVDASAGGGGGSGTGSKNYFPSDGADLETTASDWTTDDGIGGSANYLTVVRNTTTPLAGAGDLKITKSANNATGEFVKITSEAIDPADRNTGKLYGSFSFDTTEDAAYATDDFILEAYDNTNTAVLDCGQTEDLEIPDTSYAFQFVCTIEANTASIEYRLKVNSTNASAYDIYFDEFRNGPAAKVSSPIITEWQSYTPSLTGFGTPSSVEFQYRRHGDSVQIKGAFTSGTSTATEARASLPSGLTSAGTDKIATLQYAGPGTYNVAFAGHGAALIEPSVTYLTFGIQSSGTGGFAKQNASTFLTTGNRIGFTATVAIAGWGAGAVVSENELSLQTLNVTARGNGGTAITADVTNIDFTETSDSHNAWNGTGFTAPKSGDYAVEGNVYITGALGVVISAYIDGTVDRTAGYHGSTVTLHPINWSGRLEKGEVLTFRSSVGFTLNNSSTIHWLTISSKPDYTVLGVARVTTMPTVQRFTSGSGTYTTAVGVKYIKVKMAGGGGGGGGSGTTEGSAAGSGGNTTFSTRTAAGGGGGARLSGGGGGTSSGSGHLLTHSVQGGAGSSGSVNPSSPNGTQTAGGSGGNTAFGGAGKSGSGGGGGGGGQANTGGGGGGAGNDNVGSQYSGGGGGAGAYIEIIVTNPAASYSYGVGTAGSAGGAGTSGRAGGSGGSGVVIIEEYY